MHRILRAAVPCLFLAGVMQAFPLSSRAWSATGAGDSGGTISVGVSDGGSGGGGTGPSGGAGSGNGGTGGGGSSSGCTYELLPPADQASLGVGGPTPGAWYLYSCPGEVVISTDGGIVWFTDQTAPTAPTVSPYEVAEQAENSLTLPDPTLDFNPSPSAIVNLPTWLWIDPSIWHDYSVTASVDDVSATATAIPVSVTWTTGDGGTLTCDGPGIAFRDDEPSASQSTSCSHTYSTTSIGQWTPDGDLNDAEYVVSATVTWEVDWSTSNGAGGGSLPTLTTTRWAGLRVEQIESVNTDAFDRHVAGDIRIPAVSQVGTAGGPSVIEESFEQGARS